MFRRVRSVPRPSANPAPRVRVYAANTSVSVDKSRAELESTLRRYGATAFFSGWDDVQAFVAFKIYERHIKLVLPLPVKSDKRFVYKEGKYGPTKRTEQQALEAYEQELRSRFRALLLCLKAKLESVESKIETFEQAFLAHIVLPDNSLVGDRVKALVDEAYRTGKAGRLLPAKED
jgi:hypothetical protein